MFAPNQILDLHNLYFESESFVQEELEQVLDEFVSPYLLTKLSERLLIITGKGLHSKHFIDGKNPLRYYTEEYLEKIGLIWSYQDEKHGGIGAIVVEI